jgi:hypothetical protein
VLDRLIFWADRYGFTRSADVGDAFVFTRGSEWHALYTFDIRKVPTTVEVVMVPGEAGSCLCTMTCASWFQVAAPRDEWRLSEQMDLLEACLKGALAAQTTADEPLAADTERLSPPSHDIKRA